MWLLALAACDGGGPGSDAEIPTATLWVASEGRFQAYRYLDAGAAGAAGADLDTGVLGESLLQTLYATGGCSAGDGWRMEMRVGAEWNSSEPAGALHFDDAGGLALCGYEDAGTDLVAFETAVALWGKSLREGEPVESGDWVVTAEREVDLAIYYGVIPDAVSFTLKGGVHDPSGWVLHFAPDIGIVRIDATAFSADLVYVR